MSAGICDCSSRAWLMSLGAALLFTLAWVLNAAAAITCNFATINYDVKGIDETDDDTDYGMDDDASIGLWLVSNQRGYCQIISFDGLASNVPYWVDPRMTAARACSSLGLFIAFWTMIAFWFSMCCGCTTFRCIRVMIGVNAGICCALTGCMFMVNTSRVCNGKSKECSVSSGGTMAIFAMIFYFAAGIISCVASNHSDDDNDPVQTEVPPSPASVQKETHVTIEKEYQEDGTVVVTKTTIHPDGSKTVETTIEKPVIDVEATPIMNPDVTVVGVDVTPVLVPDLPEKEAVVY